MTREEAIAAVTGILVRAYSPERIYLIGSSARGTAKPDSDLDFVVVLPDDVPREALWAAGVRRQLWDIPYAVDVVRFRRRTFDRRSDWLMSLPAIAIREGRLLYERGQRAA